MGGLVAEQSKEIRGPRGSYKFEFKTLELTQHYIDGGWQDEPNAQYPAGLG